MKLKVIFGSFGKPDRYFADDGLFGKYVEITKEDYDSRLFKPAPGFDEAMASRPWTKKLNSDALSVHPKQVKEAREQARAAGIHVEIKDNGHVVFADRAQRREYSKLRGFFDRDGGYSDAQATPSCQRVKEPDPDIPDITARDGTGHRSRQESEASLRRQAEQIAREFLQQTER